MGHVPEQPINIRCRSRHSGDRAHVPADADADSPADADADAGAIIRANAPADPGA